jgi:hypothetical protein
VVCLQGCSGRGFRLAGYPVGALPGIAHAGGEAALVSSQRFCTRCGHEWRQGARFCTACGSPAPQDDVPTGLPEENQGATTTSEVAGPDPSAAGREWARLPSPAITATQPVERSSGAGSFPPSESTHQQPESPYSPPSLQPYPQPEGTYPPVADDGIPGGRGGHRSRWLLALGVAVLLAGGGTAVALYFTHSSRRGQASADVHLGTTPAAPASAPTLTPTSPPSSSPSPAAPAQVRVDGVTVGISAINNDPNAVAVARTMGTYFGGIDSRNYMQAWNTFAPALQAAIPYQPWSSSLGTTRDTHVALQDIRHDANGDVDVTVYFRSHQAPQNGPDPGETCTNWSLDYRLMPSSTSASPAYLIRKVKSVGSGHVACG